VREWWRLKSGVSVLTLKMSWRENGTNALMLDDHIMLLKDVQFRRTYGGQAGRPRWHLQGAPKK